jgi:hypothetical protein
MAQSLFGGEKEVEVQNTADTPIEEE